MFFSGKSKQLILTFYKWRFVLSIHFAGPVLARLIYFRKTGNEYAAPVCYNPLAATEAPERREQDGQSVDHSAEP
jgi:hypothetical protein